MPARASDRVAVLQAAIDGITRALATAPDEAIPELVGERAQLRGEIQALSLRSNVIALRRRT
jgi:hypothetical protein